MKNLLTNLKLNDNGIYYYDFKSFDQKEELKIRKNFNLKTKDYFKQISKNHSIPVMDHEVEIFLKKIPRNGIVLDVGGGWGWHFRNLDKIRPDVKIFILDIVIENLEIAKKLFPKMSKNIYLVHGTATKLPFPKNSISGYWSVQTLQHIPNFELAILEAYRVLNVGGHFANYSLQDQFLINLLYRFLKPSAYNKRSMTSFFIEKACLKQVNYINKIFNKNLKRRFSEFLFFPAL